MKHYEIFIGDISIFMVIIIYKSSQSHYKYDTVRTYTTYFRRRLLSTCARLPATYRGFAKAANGNSREYASILDRARELSGTRVLARI